MIWKGASIISYLFDISSCGKTPLLVAVKSDLGHMVDVLLSQRPLQEVSTNHFTKKAGHFDPTQQGKTLLIYLYFCKYKDVGWD